MFFAPKPPSPFEAEKARLLAFMQSYEPHDPKYTETAKNLETLTKAIESSKESSTKIKTVVISVFVSLAQVFTIVFYEHAHPIASKGLSFVMKPKI